MINLTILALIIGNTFSNAAPVLLTGLGGMMSEKSGVVNIGLEGMMTIGALTGAVLGYYVGNPWLAFLGGGLAGAFFGLIHAFVSVSLAGDQTISGIAINTLAPGLALFLSRLFFSGATQTPSIPLENKIPRLFRGISSNQVFNNIFGQYATVYLSLIMVVVLYVVLYKTKLGLRVIAVGEHPKASETLNINVVKVRYLSVIFSGFMGGLGGASMSLAVVSSFSPTLIAGQGYIALVTVIFGNWKPQGVLIGSLFFGLAQAIATYLGSTSIGIPIEFISMIPYIATLLILIIFKGRSYAPKSSGKPYFTVEDI
ncbi:ABC transporter permease [Anaerococcus prevotii]|uniref:ABC transporter permease n=1 Tax=Anaerococcus prevotii TaxID=33034 RepID=UPI00280426D4|nr:ABC transporter permease [Anaerococcus prevotii]MDU2557768.1 ABC transporter permease [Anaerococcus prevotii]MDU2585429.1 ABC transporter permease [Anaerococcus prevotii]MDU3136442.1 ABC transporter permease [Anaerococcus prevotii]